VGDAAAQDEAFVPQTAHSQAQHAAQVQEMETTDILEFHVLQIVPDALGRVQLRCIAGQLLPVQARRAPLSQEGLDRPIAMDRGAIPEHQQLAGDVPQQVAQEAYHGVPVIGLLLHLQQEPSIGREATDGGEVIPGQVHPQARRLPTRRIGAHHPRQEIETGLVYPDDGALLCCRFFLSAGQRSVRQAAMAASSRWVARTSGFCGLQRSLRRRRETWAG
jgi:hypothetical protein